ncbi:MAG: AAC(3) family N-acetyltransferase [Acidobacteriota bacterium]|nr:AAC(3) family N-acetyltransferase [Acidobacteriota bacterium]
MADSPKVPASVLDALEVPRGGIVYVQSSVDWMQRAGLRAPEMLSTLLDWTGPAGTLVMPSYPFHSSHQEYLRNAPTFDVRRTPAGIGLMPEMFRRTAGVVRSLDPDFSVCALGAEAEAIVGREPAEPDPFGADSSYQRMLGRGTTLVGLGVSLNTNSFIHAIDSRAAAGYPAAVYNDRVYATTVIDGRGVSRVVRRMCLRPPFQQLTTPSAIGDVMRPAAEVFATIEIAGARFFKWDLGAWSAWCASHAAAQATRGEWPCWLTRLGSAFPSAQPS